MQLYKKVLAFFLPLLLIAVQLSAEIFCADLGGTRIKSAVLHPQITLKELRDLHVTIMPSAGWLNEKLPLLFQSDSELLKRHTAGFDEISFCMTGPVMDNSEYISHYRKDIPLHLKNACEKSSGLPVFVETDGVAWARGAIYWQTLLSRPIHYPSLCITLGTGVGAAIILSPDEIISYKITFLNIPFHTLISLAENQREADPSVVKSVHKMLGREYFDWVKKEHPEWDKRRISGDFNQRLCAFFFDIQQHIEKELNIKVDSLMLGGGNSRFVSKSFLKRELKKKIVLLNPQSMTKQGVDPDIISLLGCISPSCYRPAQVLPSWEIIKNWE